jgi:uncharacterized protein (TIGR03067 family)
MRGSPIMKTLLPCALLAIFAYLGWAQSPTPAASPRNATKDLRGVWEGFVMAGDGTKTGQRRVNVTLTIASDRITCQDSGNVGEGTYRIFPGGGNFANIDATGTAGFYKGHLYQGIITTEGNNLKWCSNSGEPSQSRPAAFRSVNSAGHFLMILTRKQ